MIEYKNSLVNYCTIGDNEQVMLYLHGWGGSVDSFKYLTTSLDYKNILIDFPPFGESEDPKTPYTLFDYAEIVYKILKKENAKKLNKYIKNSRLIIYKNCGHFAYLENNVQFLIDIKTFLKGEK